MLQVAMKHRRKEKNQKKRLRNVETRKLKFMTIDLLREALNDFGRNKRGGA